MDNLSGNVGNISSTVSSSVTSLSSDIAYISANCLTAHQSLEDYYKKTETSSKQEISEALASIQPGDAEVNQVVHTYSAEGKWLIASDLDPYLQKSESGVFQPSGNYLSANALDGYATEQWVNEQGFIKTETDWTNTIKAASSNAYNEAVAQIPSLEGYATETYVQENVSSKMDKSFSSNFYPMTGNPSGFLTTHQSLDGYATTAEVDAVSSLLSAGLDYVSANAGGLTGDFSGAGQPITFTDKNDVIISSKNITIKNGSFNYNYSGEYGTSIDFSLSRNCVSSNYTYMDRPWEKWGLSTTSVYGNTWLLNGAGVSGSYYIGGVTKSWSALRNIDIGLTTDGAVSSLSGHEIGAGYTPTYHYIEV